MVMAYRIALGILMVFGMEAALLFAVLFGIHREYVGTVFFLLCCGCLAALAAKLLI